MKIKLGALVKATEGLKALQEKDLPVAESFKLLNLVQQADPILKNYGEQRAKLLEKYGETKDNLNYSIPQKNVEQYLNEMSPLEDMEINIDFQKIKLNKNIEIKVVHLQNLLDFVEMEEGE